MELTEFWKIFLKSTQYGGAVVSCVLNSVLILLILFRSPPTLGNYKYLMLYIVIFQIVYSILDVITEPTILSYGTALVVFREFKNSMLEREESFLLLIVYSGCYTFSLTLFAIHFIYRYGVVDKKFRDKYLSGYKLILLFLMPVVSGISWGAISFFFFHFDFSTDVFAKRLLFETYDTLIEDISYVIIIFYRLDEHNELHSEMKSFYVIGCMWILVMFSMFCLFYFGIKCYQKLSRGLESIQASQRARSLQQQLFLALVVQTAIPVILMYIPVTILFLFPIIQVDVGVLGSFVAATIAIYPAIDPLPTMFIVKNYRDTLMSSLFHNLSPFYQPHPIPPSPTRLPH